MTAKLGNLQEPLVGGAVARHVKLQPWELNFFLADRSLLTTLEHLSYL